MVGELLQGSAALWLAVWPRGCRDQGWGGAAVARLRLRHEAQFAAMNAAVASLKETEKTLDNMMEAWKGSLTK